MSCLNRRVVPTWLLSASYVMLVHPHVAGAHVTGADVLGGRLAMRGPRAIGYALWPRIGYPQGVINNNILSSPKTIPVNSIAFIQLQYDNAFEYMPHIVVHIVTVNLILNDIIIVV